MAISSVSACLYGFTQTHRQAHHLSSYRSTQKLLNTWRKVQVPKHDIQAFQSTTLVILVVVTITVIIIFAAPLPATQPWPAPRVPSAPRPFPDPRRPRCLTSPAPSPCPALSPVNALRSSADETIHFPFAESLEQWSQPS